MRIMHTRNGAEQCVVLSPNSTLFVFDESELPIVEHIVQMFVDTYEGEEHDAFYFQLLNILAQVRVSHTQEELQ
jgi:hypothetical protein